MIPIINVYCCFKDQSVKLVFPETSVDTNLSGLVTVLQHLNLLVFGLAHQWDLNQPCCDGRGRGEECTEKEECKWYALGGLTEEDTKKAIAEIEALARQLEQKNDG